MAQQDRNTEGGHQSRPLAFNAASVALRGIGEVYDMQVATTRLLLRTQARAAAAFGWPDYSDLFGDGDGRARRVFASGTEQVLHTMQKTNEAMAEIQRQVGYVVESETVTLAQTWQRGIEEIGEQTEENLKQLCETARVQAEEARRVVEKVGEATRSTLTETGAEVRQGMRDLSERGREAFAEAGQAAREQTERASAEGRMKSA